MVRTGQYDMTVYNSFISHEGSGSKTDLWRENTVNQRAKHKRCTEQRSRGETFFFVLRPLSIRSHYPATNTKCCNL